MPTITRVERHNTAFSSLSDMPKRWDLAEEYYQLDFIYPITDQLSTNIIAIRIELNNEAKPKYLILHYDNNNNDTTNYLRNLIDYTNKEKTAISFDIAKVTNTKLIKELYDTKLKNKNIFNQHNEVTIDRISFTKKILFDAMRMQTSDIHVETIGSIASVRFRIFTECIEYTKITKQQAEDFANVCYSTFRSTSEDEGSGDGEYKMSSLLEGEFSTELDDNYQIKGRMLNLSHNKGDNCDFIVRLIDKSKNNKAKQFSELGFSKNACEQLRKLDNISAGAILTCGITGSGKSTSQQNMLQHERNRTGGTRKMISFENPVEYPLDGVTQITISDDKEGVDNDIDFSFKNLDKKVLRADPDTISYGEVRDTVSAKAIRQGVASGHLVYGTVHCDTALSVFERLISFGLNVNDVCKRRFIALILYQHLLPKLCTHCSTPYSIGDKIPEKYNEMFVLKSMCKSLSSVNKNLSLLILKEISLKLPLGKSLIRAVQREGYLSSAEVTVLRNKITQLNDGSSNDDFEKRLYKIINNSPLQNEDFNIRFRGDGCKNCHFGYNGVSPASEVIIPDDQLLSLIKDGNMIKAELYWRSNLQGQTAAEDSYSKIFSGIVDPRIVEEHLALLGE